MPTVVTETDELSTAFSLKFIGDKLYAKKAKEEKVNNIFVNWK